MTSTRTGHAQERRFVLSTGRYLWISTAVALCLLMIPLAACQPADQQLDLVGVWIDPERAHYIQFDTDGIWIAAHSFEGLSASPLAFGPHHLEGTLLTFETDEESDFCRGQTATYEVELSDQEELTFTSVDDPCAERKLDFIGGPWERYSP